MCRRFALRGAAGARPSERVALLLAERPNGKRFWAFLHARDLEVPELWNTLAYFAPEFFRKLSCLAVSSQTFAQKLLHNHTIFTTFCKPVSPLKFSNLSKKVSNSILLQFATQLCLFFFGDSTASLAFLAGFDDHFEQQRVAKSPDGKRYWASLHDRGLEVRGAAYVLLALYHVDCPVPAELAASGVVYFCPEVLRGIMKTNEIIIFLLF